MQTIVLTINGKKIACREGTSVFEAAAGNGIAIPSLCYHPDLKPYGACRLCLVEEEKSGRLFASCVTPAARDMVIQTDSPRVLTHRKNIVRLMMAEHPESCIVCNKGNRCELRRIAAKLGIGENDLYPMPNYKSFEQLNPFIIRDLSKCILCGKCIRADHELVCTGAIDYNHRGFQSRPATAHEMPLEQSNCTFCGTCVSICPTGALSPKNNRYAGTPEREALSVCGFCGIGCTLNIGAAGDKIVEINPGDFEDTVNHATLCVRGHFSHDFLNSADRLTAPMIRKTDEAGKPSFEEVSWEKAMAHAVSKLTEIKRTHGPQSIAFIGSTQCSVEENYLFQKIGRAIFQSENIVSMTESRGQAQMMALDQKTDGNCRINRLMDLENAPAIVVLGPDPDHAAPVLGYHIKRAAKKGAVLIVVNPLSNELSMFAGQWIRPSLSKNPEASLAALLNGIAKELIAQNGHDSEFIESHTDAFKDYAESLSTRDTSELARMAAVSESDLETAATLLAGKQTAFVIGQAAGGYLSEAGFNALFNLALLTGSTGRMGTGIHLMAEANNWMGACDMGISPAWLPGRTPLSDEAGRGALEKAWQSKISPDPGLDMVRLIESAENGTLKAVYIMGENPLRKLPQPDRVEKAFKNLELFIVQDILLTRTAKLAHLILPGAAFTEKAGAFTSMEGRIQNFTPVAAPPGDARPDWEILALLAAKMGYPEPYDSLEQIKQEIRRLVPIYADLGSHRQGWIKNQGSKNGFRFHFSPADIPDIPDIPSYADSARPYIGIISGLRYHMGGGTRTSRSERIHAYQLKGQIEISTHDAKKLDLSETDRLRVSSAYGQIEREVRINGDMPAGQVFIPLAYNGNDAMHLVDLSPAPASDAPGWAVCRVNLEKIETSGEM
ncbi:MAG: molybdopterin-dependent oxidoreductase [Desulfobacterales bacterium]